MRCAVEHIWVSLMCEDCRHCLCNYMSWSMLSEADDDAIVLPKRQATFHFQVIPGNATLIFDVELLSFSGK